MVDDDDDDEDEDEESWWIPSLLLRNRDCDLKVDDEATSLVSPEREGEDDRSDDVEEEVEEEEG